MNDKPVIRDERTVAVADTSSRFAYMVLAFGVLIDAFVRALVFRQACLDLVGLVCVSSMVVIVYQRVKRVQTLPRHGALLTLLLGMAIGLATVFAAMMLLKR